MIKPTCKKKSAQSETVQGQSLVEFVLVMPIFVLVLMGATYMAMNFYQAEMASDALRQTALKKLEMARQKDQVNAGTLAGYVNGGSTKGNFSMGSLVDQVTFVDGGPYATLVIGNKQTMGVSGIIPGLSIHTAQAINRNLLLPANGGASAVRSATTSWVPGGAPTPPPW